MLAEYFKERQAAVDLIYDKIPGLIDILGPDHYIVVRAAHIARDCEKQTKEQMYKIRAIIEFVARPNMDAFDEKGKPKHLF